MPTRPAMEALQGRCNASYYSAELREALVAAEYCRAVIPNTNARTYFAGTRTIMRG
jgi:hypothetical protein